MSPRTLWPCPASVLSGACLLSLLLTAGCGGSAQASYGNGPATAKQPSYELHADEGTSEPPLGEARFRAEVCQGIDVRPSYDAVTVDDVDRLLRAQGYTIHRDDERKDLSYLDVSGNGAENVRLRVATLPSVIDAGRDLHQAILQHGPGSWGVHRSRVAILAPIGDVSRVMRFAERSKLACWGEVMMAGRDDTFVIPGGYREP